MTDRYAVIGNPIGHTKSPMIHTSFAALTGQDIAYTALEGPLQPADGFEQTVRAFRDGGGRGMNVTVPFKLRAFAMADQRSERAELAGAVNALKFDGGRILAENFDGIGLVNDIQRNLGFPMAGTRVLLLGAGGAARGALLPFLEQGLARLTVANRHPDKAHALVEPYVARFTGRTAVTACGYEDLIDQPYDLVVNATSASLYHEPLPLPTGVFTQHGLAYDLLYGKGMTPFLRQALDAGTQRVADGVGMLIEQAAEAFEWWRGVRPDTTALIAKMTVPLE
jgi:shikimate dehydrogenase